MVHCRSQTREDATHMERLASFYSVLQGSLWRLEWMVLQCSRASILGLVLSFLLKTKQTKKHTKKTTIKSVEWKLCLRKLSTGHSLLGIWLISHYFIRNEVELWREEAFWFTSTCWHPLACHGHRGTAPGYVCGHGCGSHRGWVGLCVLDTGLGMRILLSSMHPSIQGKWSTFPCPAQTVATQSSTPIPTE